jgi:hypothetical protein
VNSFNAFEDALRVGLADLAASQTLDSVVKPSMEGLGGAKTYVQSTQSGRRWTHKWGAPVVLATLSVVIAATLAVSLAHPFGTESSQPVSGASSGVSPSASTDAPVYAAVPAIERACPNFTSPSGTTSDEGLVTVDPRPFALVAAWYGGMNRETTPCVTLTHTTIAQAELIANDIRTAAALPAATEYENCGADDASQVVLYFSYQGVHDAQTATVKLNGCIQVGAAGRLSRTVDSAMYADLIALAPPSVKVQLNP